MCSLWTCSSLHKLLELTTHSSPIFVCFLCVLKLGLALCLCLLLWFAANFSLKYKKHFKSCLFLSEHLKLIAISPCQFRLAIHFSCKVTYIATVCSGFILKMRRSKRKESSSTIRHNRALRCQQQESRSL